MEQGEELVVGPLLLASSLATVVLNQRESLGRGWCGENSLGTEGVEVTTV